MLEPVTLVVYVAGLAALGAAWGYKRAQLRRFLRTLARHPRIEVREQDQGRLLFSAIVECAPRGTVSAVLDRTTGALEWTLRAHLLRAERGLDLAFDQNGVRASHAPLARRLGASSSLSSARDTLFADTWEIQRLALVDRHLLLEARERARLSELAADVVVRRADDLSHLAEVLAEQLGERAPSVPLCPLCRNVELIERAGMLDEAACPNCRGRFLRTDAARCVFESELGVDLFALKSGTAPSASAEMCCAACHSRMRPVPVGELIVNLCGGCGSVWLDENELELLSEGRYREIGL